MTWGADQHVLCALAFGWWLYARTGDALTTLVASELPHAIKQIFDQQRPDRLTALGHLHGIPISEKRLDAFPSGHAVHIGALASAATVLPPAQRNTAWMIGGGFGADAHCPARPLDQPPPLARRLIPTDNIDVKRREIQNGSLNVPEVCWTSF
jgi:hypothetical protein